MPFSYKTMNQRYQILCINDQNHPSENKLSFIGGKNPLGETWVLSVDQAIKGIESGKWEFFVNWEKQSFEIEILLDPSNDKTLGTPKAPDRKNLLFLLAQYVFS